MTAIHCQTKKKLKKFQQFINYYKCLSSFLVIDTYCAFLELDWLFRIHFQEKKP